MLKCGKKRLQQDDSRSRRNKNSPGNYTNNGGFFIRPYLTIEPLDKPTTKNIIISNAEGAGYTSKEIDPGRSGICVWARAKR
jgi:hypothetical protein